VWLEVALLGLLSIGAFVGGVSFVLDPTGRALGAQLKWLEQTPVTDFLLPGLFLLLVFAIGSVLLIAGLLWRPTPGVLDRIDARLRHHWAWVGTIAMGATLVAWILYEFTLFPDRIALQPILIGLGLALIALAALPSMRRYAAVPGATARARGGDPR
jgi:hypothetical protein